MNRNILFPEEDGRLLALLPAQMVDDHRDDFDLLLSIDERSAALLLSLGSSEAIVASLSSQLYQGPADDSVLTDSRLVAVRFDADKQSFIFDVRLASAIVRACMPLDLFQLAASAKFQGDLG